MKHIANADYPIEALTGISPDEALAVAHIVQAFDFFDHPHPNRLRSFLSEGISTEISSAIVCADANAADVRAAKPAAVAPTDDLFDEPFRLSDLLEKIEALTDEETFVLFGYLLGLHHGRGD